MQLTDRIDAIERRAEAINLTLARICKAAKVHHSTVTRWRNAEVDPKLNHAAAICERLEREVERREAAIRAHLGASPEPCRMSA